MIRHAIGAGIDDIESSLLYLYTNACFDQKFSFVCAYGLLNSRAYIAGVAATWGEVASWR